MQIQWFLIKQNFTVATQNLKKVIPCNGYNRDEVLRISACFRRTFPHSVVNALLFKELLMKIWTILKEHAEVNYVVANEILNLNGERKVLIGS